MAKKLYFQLQWFTIIIFFLTGITLGVLGMLTWLFNNSNFVGIKKIHPTNVQYEFINPLLAIDSQVPTQFLASSALQNKLTALINQRKQDGQITNASVYVRDIESGRWAGVNENFKFSPGKLLKLAVMIAYFKSAESDPTILQKQLLYQSSTTTNSSTLEETTLENNQQYSVKELIRDMIVNDTNTTASILYDNIDHQALDAVFSDLGIDFHEDKESDDYLSVKSYSLMLRVLYNATYLNRNFSEEALSILADTDKTIGIAAALPNGIIVAHKFRSRQFILQNKTGVETHDCGIVYIPEHPFQLCVMAISQNETPALALFRDIGQMVYNDMKLK